MTTRAVRDALLARCKGYCESCGWPLQTNWAAHHRKLRSHGRDDSLSNLVALHHNCHNLATDSVHLSPGPAYERGLLVRSYEDPSEVPLILRDGKAVLLSDTYTEVRHGNDALPDRGEPEGA